jgi:hypothetical protein
MGKRGMQLEAGLASVLGWCLVKKVPDESFRLLEVD